MHFGIIFIVNLEIGYLTPPVGLNLFVASALYRKRASATLYEASHRSWALMLIGLAIITWYPQLSVGLGNAIMGGDPKEMVDEDGKSVGGMPTMEEMMREAAMADEEAEDEEARGARASEKAPEPDPTE